MITQEQIARRFFDECVQPSQSDSVVVLFDTASSELAFLIATAASSSLAQGCAALYVPRISLEAAAQCGTLPQSVSANLARATITITCIADVDRYARFRSLAVGAARTLGHKVIHLPGVSRDNFLHAVSATDFKDVESVSQYYLERLQSAVAVRIDTATNDRALSLSLRTDGRSVHACGGRARAGAIMNLPTGEVYVAPVEGTASGDISLVGSTDHMIFRKHDDIVLHFEHGVLIVADSHFGKSNRARDLKQYLEALPDVDRTLCEFGIGTNRAVNRLTGQEVHDEKHAGTVHIAIGNNAAFGGGNTTSSIHRDMIITGARLFLDAAEVSLPQSHKR